MEFPKNYPYSPPSESNLNAKSYNRGETTRLMFLIEFRFNRSLWHPNIYSNGDLCISILHTPGEDEQSGELAAERWSPAQRVESVLVSILSLLDDAECSSPANVDAGVQLRMDPNGYRAQVRRDVEMSKADIPEGFVMPTFESTLSKPTADKDDVKEEMDFWADSDVDEDPFGGKFIPPQRPFNASTSTLLRRHLPCRVRRLRE